MTDLSIADKDFDHLLPDFAALLKKAIAQATHESAGKFPGFSEWRLFEGYRSQARQTWLYASGRSRPGPIVTKDPVAHFHGYGLAGDVIWYDVHGQPHWDGDPALWSILGHAARTFGLDWGGDWRFHDLPHIQASAAQYAAWKRLAVPYLKSQGLTTP